MTLLLVLLVLGTLAVWLDVHRDRSLGLAGSSDVVDRDRQRVRAELRSLT